MTSVARLDDDLRRAAELERGADLSPEGIGISLNGGPTRVIG